MTENIRPMFLLTENKICNFGLYNRDQNRPRTPSTRGLEAS